jgi:hypothetical protein
MDPTRFDQLARALGRSASRRRALGILAGAAALGGATRSTAATGRQRQKRAKPPGDPGQPELPVCHHGHTLSLPIPAAEEHLADGDRIGPCGAPGAGFSGCTPIENLCLPPWTRPCCANAPCTKILPTVGLSPATCQSNNCSGDAQCAGWFPNQDVYCEKDTFKCSGFRATCCLPKPCGGDGDCPNSRKCCHGRCCARGQACTPTGCFGGTSG